MSRTIELTESREWLTEFGPLANLDDHPLSDDLVGEWWRRAAAQIEERLPGVEVVTPPPHRSGCHAWHGATVFRRQGYGAATMDDLTDGEWDHVVHACQDAAEQVATEHDIHD